MKEIKYKKCSICNGSGRRTVITKVGLVTIPIVQCCPSCGGIGKVKIYN
ncbi:hypothetical protein [Clostridium tetani]